MVCKIPWTGPELTELQTDFCESWEIKYLWRVSLTRADLILLSDVEASRYWGPRVFLSNEPVHNHSITPEGLLSWGRAQERDSQSLKVKGLSQLPEGIQVAACIQTMYVHWYCATIVCSGRSQPPQTPPQKITRCPENIRSLSYGENSGRAALCTFSLRRRRCAI